MEQDTRGWKPKSVGETKEPIPGSRTGVNRHETREVSISFNAPAKSPVPPGVPQDNMGNSHSNKGAERPEFNAAQTTDNIPSVPLSGFEGVEVGDADGVKLSMEAGTQPDLHPREMRDVYGKDKAPKSSAIMGGEGMSITKEHHVFKRARIPMSKAMHSSIFMGDGNNSAQEEDMGEKGDHAKAKPEFEKGKKSIKKGSK